MTMSRSDNELHRIFCTTPRGVWVWKFEGDDVRNGRWLWDSNASGGPPSVHEEPVTPPPFRIEDDSK